MNVDAYLTKIGCPGLKEISLENLQKIQANHLSTFAFENLDMHLGKEVKFSLEDSYDRLMNKSRGGYCLQLNGIFGWALKQLGYDVFYLECFVYNTFLKNYYRLPIHIIPIVRLNEKIYYVDAGTVRMVNSPILIEPGVVQKTQLGVFRFKTHESDSRVYILERSSNAQNDSDYQWVEQIKFVIEPKEYELFREMNDYVQTKEHPTIYYRTVISKQFENGMRTLVGFKYAEIIFSDSGESRKEKMVSLEEAKQLIKDKFELTIDDSFVPVDNLNLNNNR